MERNLLNRNAGISHLRKWLLTAMIISGTLLSAQAHTGTDKEKAVVVTPLGVREGNLVFNLSYSNPELNKFTIELIDGQGLRLYKEVVSGKAISRTFKTPSDLGTITLIVTNKKSGTKEKYGITPETRVVEEVVVTNVD